MEHKGELQLLQLARVTPSWGGVVKAIQNTDLLNPYQKEKGLLAAAVFQRVLGNGFFRDNGHEHPLQRSWSNIVPWQIEQLCEWATTLEELQVTSNAAGFQYLRDILRNKARCQQEGIHFLRVATRLLKAGFAISFIESNHSGKSPDIAVNVPVTGAVFYIEVTHLEKKDSYKQDEKNFHYISSCCMHFAPFLLTYVKLLRRPAARELNQAISLIAETAKYVRDTGILQHRSTDLIEITFAPEPAIAPFNEWLAANGKQKGVWGLEINPDETERLTERGRINKKVKQLPPNATGIIYFGVEFLYFFNMDVPKVLAALKKAMAPHAKLKGIVLCCHSIDPQESYHVDFEGSDDVYSVHSVEGYTTTYMYCVNDQYAGDVPHSVLQQFRGTFIPEIKSDF